MAESKKRRRYRDPVSYQEQRQRVAAAVALGVKTEKEPPSDLVEVVKIKGPKGSIRVYKDQVARYEKVFADMAVRSGK